MTITSKTQLTLLQWLSPPVPRPSMLWTSKPQPAAGAHADSVQITNLVKAALEEATETPYQNAQEARNGDLQAQLVLAREAAERKGMQE